MGYNASLCFLNKYKSDINAICVITTHWVDMVNYF